MTRKLVSPNFTRLNIQGQVSTSSTSDLSVIKLSHDQNVMLAALLCHFDYESFRGLEEIKKFQNSEKNSEVGGWVHGQLGLKKIWKIENRVRH